ncbi:MAG: PQQ-like beta-propeller repeat protein [Gemmataceae bacterium]|nr:PQQ-like beta-propeller repeat protein [Gemmataceae bacterium]
MRASISGVFVMLMLDTSLRAAEPPAWPQFGGPRRDFVCPAPVASSADGPVWRRTLGPGTSGIVTDGTRLFTQYSIPVPDNTKQGEELLVALEPDTGRTVWEARWPVARLPKQETFSGDPVRPQATPAVARGLVCCLGYAGVLKCYDAASGNPIWEHDLVKGFGATPVQFGFAASPLVLGDWFVVHVGGSQSVLVAFHAESGQVAWKSEPGEPSYASPVVAQFDGDEQIVQVTRDHIMGFAARNGETRWKYPLPKPGLTNVPTPVVLPDQRLLISGQGANGTRLLRIERRDGSFAASEVWANEKERFFYCNTLADGDAVYGSYGALFGALDLKTGKELWRNRGQAECNLLRVGTESLILRGDGQVARARISKDGVAAAAGTRALDGRCWTAPTLLGDLIYVRDQKEIAAVRWSTLAATSK